MKPLWMLASAIPALLLASARAADLDALTAALRQARTLEARGQVEITVNFPPRQTPNRTAARLPSLPFHPALLKRNFTVLRSDTEQVAGRAVARYDLLPRTGRAAHWCVWTDRTWNVPLGFVEYSADGSVSRRAMFHKVNELPVAVRPRSAAPPLPHLAHTVQSALPGLRLPPGFAAVALKQTGDRWNITLSDGANTLALVAARRDVQAAPGLASRQVGDRYLWIIGNLPTEELARTLANVRRVDESALQGALSAVP